MMNKICIIFLLFSVLLTEQLRLITIGGCVTETVFLLGRGDDVVAVDQSSNYLSKIDGIPQVGYIRAISSEGILSMYPDRIFTTSDIGPPMVIKQIQNSGVDLEIFDSPKNINDILMLIENIGAELGEGDEAVKINKEIRSLNLYASEIKSKYINKPKIAFFMNPSANYYSAAGSQTKADYLMDYIGGNNVFSTSFEKYSKVTKEEIVFVNPDIILIGSVMSQNKDELFSVFNKKEFESINAVKNNKIFYIDMGKALSFGPSFVQNAIDLMLKIDNVSK